MLKLTFAIVPTLQHRHRYQQQLQMKPARNVIYTSMNVRPDVQLNVEKVRLG
jgi:hypothetical protein